MIQVDSGCNKIQIFNTKTIVFVSYDNDEISFYDIDTGNFICYIRKGNEEESEYIETCTILKDGTLVTVGSDKLIRFWS